MRYKSCWLQTIIIFVLLAFNIGFAYPQTYISEVNFVDIEYVEIYSDLKLNLSQSLFYDDAGAEKANILKLVKNSDSNYYLIAGSNFLDFYNIEDLDCNIYYSGKTNLGYRNLRNAGENFTLQINESFNLSFVKIQDYNFNVNQSLNYNLGENLYVISNKTPCLPFREKGKQEENKEEKQDFDRSNETGEDMLQNNLSQISCKDDFEINLYEERIFSQAEFSFLTNLNNYTIEYWIENYGGEIVKDKYKTKNKNKKTYTPKGSTEIYVIKSFLHDNDNGCIYHSEKEFLYYNNKAEKHEEKVSLEKEKINDIESYVSILNKGKLFFLKDNFIEFEIYKGSDTKKRSVYLFIDNYKIASFETYKNSKIKGRAYIDEYADLISKNFNISIIGLNKSDFASVKISKTTNNTITRKSNKPEINFFSFENNTASFNISYYENQTLEFECYISRIKTKVSNVQRFNLSKSNFSLTLNINETRLNKKLKSEKNSNTDLAELKLTCRYKSPGKSYYNYLNKNFNYTFLKVPKTKKSLVFAERDFNLNNVDENFYDINFQNYVLSKKKPFEELSLVAMDENLLESDNEVIYESKSIKSKNNSYFLAFAALCLLSMGFIIVW